MSKKITTQSFIEKASVIHNNKYDYSKTEYKYAQEKVTITCPIHGDFKQTPNKHLQGQGCPECAKSKMGHRSTQKEFIEKAKTIFPNYDYSKVEYINSQTKIIVVCPIHGEFKIIPNNLLRGFGCSKCSKKFNSTEDFIKKAQEVHGNKYDYSKTKWINSSTKVEIICPKHGSFLQNPYGHINGRGCSMCAKENNKLQIAKSKGEQYIEEWCINNNIKYEHNSYLKIEELNIYVDFKINNIIIEYNGKQHYEYTSFFHKSKLDFLKQQYRDQKLRNYCKNNGIKLIEIRYDQKIEEELEKIKPLLVNKENDI